MFIVPVFTADPGSITVAADIQFPIPLDGEGAALGYIDSGEVPIEAFHDTGPFQHKGGVSQGRDAGSLIVKLIFAIDDGIVQRNCGTVGNGNLVVSAQAPRKRLPVLQLVVGREPGQVNDLGIIHLTAGQRQKNSA